MKWTLAQQRLYRWQVAALDHATGRFGDDARRDLLERITGQRSTSEINEVGMGLIIEEQAKLLLQCGVRTRAPACPAWAGGRPRPRGDRRRLTQDEYIEVLVRKLGWDGQPERLGGMIRMLTRGWKTGVPALTTREKTMLINALRNLLRDIRAGKASGERPACRDDCGAGRPEFQQPPPAAR